MKNSNMPSLNTILDKDHLGSINGGTQSFFVRTADPSQLAIVILTDEDDSTITAQFS
jgi:hypothetical protein